MGELLTIWTVRLAVGCYLGRYLLDAMPAADNRRQRQSRWLWTVGCLLYLMHVVCAFAFFHDWSHDRAYAHTASQTQEVIGWNWGGGLYVNYLFTIVWIADVIRQWNCIGNGTRSSRLPDLAMQSLIAFMVINATIVFGPPFWKWIGVVFGLAMYL
ncbi:MAG: hypothetical protein HOL01_14685, partial [Planctomycetaceae bacterium]|nr:hypothetical protein [Planctomycetaceae bacterium]